MHKLPFHVRSFQYSIVRLSSWSPPFVRTRLLVCNHVRYQSYNRSEDCPVQFLRKQWGITLIVLETETWADENGPIVPGIEVQCPPKQLRLMNPIRLHMFLI